MRYFIVFLIGFICGVVLVRWSLRAELHDLEERRLKARLW
jgi:hypothetical protein